MIDLARVQGIFALFAFGLQAGRSSDELTIEMVNRWPDATSEELAAVTEKLRRMDRDLSAALLLRHPEGNA